MTSREQMIEMFRNGAVLDKHDVARMCACTPEHAARLLRQTKKKYGLYVVEWRRSGSTLLARWGLTPPPRPVARPKRLTNAERLRSSRKRRRKMKQELGWKPPKEPWALLWDVVVRARHPAYPRRTAVSHYLIDDE